MSDNGAWTSPTTFGKSVENMMVELNNQDVELVIYSPTFFGGEDWHVSLKKQSPAVKIEVRVTKNTLLASMREAYERWHSIMDKRVREELGVGMIEQDFHITHQAAEMKNNELDKLAQLEAKTWGFGDEDFNDTDGT